MRPPIPDAPEAVSDAPGPVSAAPGAASDASPIPGRRMLSRPQRVAASAVALAALALALTGLYLSFNNVAKFAHEELGFHSLEHGQLFIGGVDLGILTLIAVDLLLAWLGRPVTWIRYPVWLLTAATMALNSASAAPTGGWEPLDYVAVAAHAVVPVLFIAIVEIGRYVIDQVVRPDRERTSIPVHRWLLAPVSTARLYRRMRLWSLTYEEIVRRDADLRGYRIWLERLCAAEKRKPTADELLPITLAPHGYTVTEALALPGIQAGEAEERRRAAEEREREAEVARAEADATAKVRKAEARKTIRIAEIAAQAQVEEAERAAEDQRTAAERAAAHHGELIETAEMAEARARAAKAEREEAEERARQAEAEAAEEVARRETALLETAKAAEARARAAKAAREEAEEKEKEARALAAADTARREAALIETADAAEARKRAAEADRRAAEERARKAEADQLAARREAEARRIRTEAIEAERRAIEAAAETERRAAETRRAIAEIEARAAEAEDAARLTPRQRAVRRLARIALRETDGDLSRIPLERITGEFGVASSTASEYRSEAHELLASGYRP
ncbi:DUF2637 domain-containing protein [Streptomyces calidiresistens]|uniref:DUF2637 domain-containing protein n=2 Tax=Streptomyces calidiresistens TaxID=1485586 RepID=A0A7W3XYG6_9ACTN|nr:DUF2637 domain-containing protein [Streptomyces calidiresistens]